MTIIKALERLSYAYFLLKRRMTGPPTVFGKKLGLASKSQLYNVLDDLKQVGLPIEYCKKDKTYYLKEEVNFDIENFFTNLKKEELNKIKGGIAVNLENKHLSPIISASNNLYLQHKHSMIPTKCLLEKLKTIQSRQLINIK